MDRREEQDEYIGPAEQVVEYSNIGTFMPVGSYRPIPIVWFAGAIFLQGIALTVLFLVLLNKPPVFPILTTALISFAIGRWTFGRGMADASTAWKVITVTMLVFNWALTTFGVVAVHLG